MDLKERVRRAVVPAVLRYYQWRGDPIARWFRPADKADPYPTYDDIRGRGRLVRSRLGAWITASHGTAEAILRDRRFSSSPTHSPRFQPPSYPEGDPRAELPDHDLLSMDPPDHTRVRRLFSGALTPKSVADLEPWIRETVTELLDAADPAGFDLIDGLAFPLPLAVICRLLGVPATDRDKFREWGHGIAATLEPQTTAQVEKDQRAAHLALNRYLRDLIDERRAEPDDSLLSALIAAEEEGDRLSPDELAATALLLFVAGFETTVNLIGNGTVALLRDRGQWEKLVADPSLAAAAVDEILRLDSPVQATTRFATTEVEVDGAVFKKGTPVMVALGGANRDPALFDEPDRLRIGRPDAARHVSLSLGIHHCPGANLARLEGRIALEELARRFPDLELAGEPVRRPLLILRGFEHVPVRCAGA